MDARGDGGADAAALAALLEAVAKLPGPARRALLEAARRLGEAT